jgi:anti-anti-sigma factor
LLSDFRILFCIPISSALASAPRRVFTVILELTKGHLGDGISVLTWRGSIHTGPDCRRLEHEVEDLIAQKHNRVVFDFTGLTHIDSSAIGSVVRCFTKLKTAGGSLRLAGCTGMIESSLRLAQLHRIIESFPTAAAAAESFPPATPAA